MGLFRLISAAVAVYLSFWMFRDAQRRGFSLFTSLSLAILALFIPFVVLPIYFIAFPKRGKASVSREKTLKSVPKLCSKCGEENKADASVCRACGNHLVVE